MKQAKLHFNNVTYNLSLFDSYYLQTNRKPSTKNHADVETILNLMQEGDDNLPHGWIDFFVTFDGVRVAPSTLHNLMLDNQE